MKLLKTVLICLVIIGVFGGAMFALNLHTGPLIEAGKLGAVTEILNKVMPNGSAYKEITEELSNLPESVAKVYSETNGKGFVVECNATSKYTAETPMNIFVGVDATGKICGISLEKHSESLIFGADYPATYIGKDSAMAGVELYAGSTFSSQAFKGAVEEALGALIANNLIKAGEKSPEQVLTELIATVHPDMAPGGVLAATKVNATGNITVAYKSTNNTGYAYIMAKGDANYLVIVNVAGEAKVYDVKGNDVTADNAELIAEAIAHVESDKLSVLMSVMPDAAGFESIYDATKPGESSLTGVASTVLAVYKETSGKGYVVRSTGIGYNKEAPIEITMGITADGKIIKVQIDSYNDTPSYDITKKDPNFLTSFEGQDSTLADVTLVAGSTFSSTGVKNAVADGFAALISNDLITAGKKSDDQILTEMISVVAPGFTKLSETTAAGSVKKAMKAENGTGFAFIMNTGDANYLAVVNAMGVCKVYDVEGNDVTAEQTALVEEALGYATSNTYVDALKKKIEKMMPGATNIQEIALDTFNTVVSAVSFKVGNTTYYGFYSRSIGFHQMDVYLVIDENGAIAKIDAKQFIFDEEYFMNFGGMNVGEYKDGFVGFTGETWTGDAAIIATATMTSNAMKESTADAFASFDSIKGGE